MSWKYRPNETDTFYGEGAPTLTTTRPSMYIDQTTGVTYVTINNGTTWYQISGGVSAGGGIGNADSLLAAARTITAADHGKTFYLNLVGGFTVTLPTAAAALRGLRVRFVVEIAPTTAYIIQTGNSAEQLLAGLVHSSTGGDADSETAFTGTNVNFVASTAVIGDWCEITSCGATGWHAACFCNADGGITITG